ncbi:MAG: calcium/sodium antiporter [Gemmatimonadota bacterium]
MALPSLLVAIGAGFLYLGAEWLVKGAARLADSLGISPIVVGLTVVSLGTSAPEMVVCVLAALDEGGDLAMGNVLGSNLANLGLILGLAAVLSPFKLAGRVVAREVPIMLVVTLLVFPLILDLRLGRFDGAILLAVLTLYLVFIGWTAEEEEIVLEEYEELSDEPERDDGSGATPVGDFGLLVVGAAAVVFGGHLVVTNARQIALDLGVSELVIGLTVVAIGTSLPELATSLVATVRKESDIAVGNIIGSNIFNVAAVLGVTSAIAPIDVSPTVLRVELPAVVAVSFLILFIALGSREIRRWEGAVLLASYVGAGFWVFL